MPSKSKNHLYQFFHPRSVAVIGASDAKGKLGNDLVLNLLKNFSGRIYPVNLDDKIIAGLKAYPSILKIKEKVDLAIIAIPAVFVPEAVAQCGQSGCKNIVIISAGFREIGQEGEKLENQLLKLKQKYSLNIMGPNCLGYINTHLPVDASFAATFPLKGNVAFFSQSGALGTAVLDMAEAQRLGLAYFASIGNKIDLGEIELLPYFAQDGKVKVILAYLESINEGEKFRRLAYEASRKKPVIILKSGKTEKGQRAVSSHTGALAGSAQAYHTAFRQAGAIEAEDVDDFFNYAEGFSCQPLPKGNQVAVITNAGGPGILVTDLLPQNGLELAALSKSTVASLKPRLPKAASVHNPIDVLGDAKADRYSLAFSLAAKDPGVDAIIVVLTPQKMTQIKETAEVVGRLSRKFKKTTILCFLGEANIANNYSIYKRYSLPHYYFPAQAVKVLGQMRRYAQWRKLPAKKEAALGPKQKIGSSAKSRLRKNSLTEAEARVRLSAFAFPWHRAQLVKTGKEAVAAAKKIGYPVALKVVSPQVIHKSDVGGVRLNLKDDAELTTALAAMNQKIKAHQKAKIDGFLVGEMVKGLEVIVGLKRDEQFGPMLMVGAGGIYAEIFKDVAFRLAPIDRSEALEMISELKIYPLFHGARGQKPLDMAALADVLVKLSEVSLRLPEIKEIDFNPVMVMDKGRGVKIVDVRVGK